MRRLRHPYTWGREHPLAVDALIAAAVATLGLATELFVDVVDVGGEAVLNRANAFSVLLVLAGTLPLVARRRYPVAVCLIVAAVTVAHSIGLYPGAGPFLGLLFAIYAVTAYTSRRTATWCLVGSVALAVYFVATSPFPFHIVDAAFTVGAFVGAWLLGDNLRIRRAYTVSVEERAAQLERQQHVEAERAVTAERARIARELHDIVAHAVSVMVVQAGAARRSIDRAPAQAAEAIGQVEENGRGALDEMRRLVGVLRSTEDPKPPEDAPEPLGPQPDLDEVPALVAHCRKAGLEVTYQVEGTPRPVPSGMGLIVYRIIQEALTNTMKHAGPAVQAEVTLTYGRRLLSLLVVDDGRGAAAPVGGHEPRRANHGLAGMVERVTLYNGEMRSGPRRGGGFRVWVRLPLAQAVKVDV